MSIRDVFTALAFLLPFVKAETANVTCIAIWMFTLPCTKPVSALVKQVKTWSTQECIDSQETCMYEILKELPAYLEVEHTSQNRSKTTKVSFFFKPPTQRSFCKVVARSTTTPHNVTSPNEYCLIHNLFQESGLTKASGYREICENKMCPAKESATCMSSHQYTVFPLCRSHCHG